MDKPNITLNVSLSTEKVDEFIKNTLIDFDSGKYESVDEAKQHLRDSILNNINELIVIEPKNTKPIECESVDFVKASDIVISALRREMSRR